MDACVLCMRMRAYLFEWNCILNSDCMVVNFYFGTSDRCCFVRNLHIGLSVLAICMCAITPWLASKRGGYVLSVGGVSVRMRVFYACMCALICSSIIVI